jgi:hypothetical protein
MMKEMRKIFSPTAVYVIGATLVFAAVAMNDDSVLAPIVACFGMLLIVLSFEIARRGNKQ